MTKYPKLMAAFFAVCMLSVVSQVAVANDYPGMGPSWNDRFTVTCSMNNESDGKMRGSFSTGGLDYAQAGSQLLFLNQGLRDWYEALRGSVAAAGGDTRLVPDFDDPIKAIIGIEADISQR